MYATGVNIALLEGVQGAEGKMNRVMYKKSCLSSDTGTCDPTTDRSTFSGDLLFFPGDIQNSEALMVEHHQCRDFVAWSYERTLNLLSSKFPCCDIWLIVPSKKAYGTICVYKNFVKSESVLGVPAHDTDVCGLVHLHKLFENAKAKAGVTTHTERLILMGFSKGCVVLNQCLYELVNYTAGSENYCGAGALVQFLHKVKYLYWLDGGHSGENDNWVTDPAIIANIPHSPWSKVSIWVHVSPYQVNDPHRPWKGESEKEFVTLLKSAGVVVVEKHHFEDMDISIDTHFKILNEFC